MINLVDTGSPLCHGCVHYEARDQEMCAAMQPCGTLVWKETGASTLTEPSAKWNGTLTLSK